MNIDQQCLKTKWKKVLFSKWKIKTTPNTQVLILIIWKKSMITPRKCVTRNTKVGYFACSISNSVFFFYYPFVTPYKFTAVYLSLNVLGYAFDSAFIFVWHCSNLHFFCLLLAARQHILIQETPTPLHNNISLSIRSVIVMQAHVKGFLTRQRIKTGRLKVRRPWLHGAISKQEAESTFSMS